MPTRKTTISAAIAVTALFLTALTTGLLTSNPAATPSVTTSNADLGVYTDSECTKNCTGLDEVQLAPDTSTTIPIYVKNLGNVPMTLSLTTSSWAPTNAESYLTLSWDRQGYVLDTQSSILATITLTSSASSVNLRAFSFAITITGTE